MSAMVRAGIVVVRAPGVTEASYRDEQGANQACSNYVPSPASVHWHESNDLIVATSLLNLPALSETRQVGTSIFSISP